MKRNTGKRLFMLGFIVAFALIFSACAANPEPTVDPDAPDADLPGTEAPIDPEPTY